MTYAGLNAAATTELEKIESRDERARLAHAAVNSGIGEPHRAYFLKALRHKLGHKPKRGTGIVPLPTPPAGLKPGELAFIDQRVAAAAESLKPPPAPERTPPAIPAQRAPVAQRDRGRSLEEA